MHTQQACAAGSSIRAWIALAFVNIDVTVTTERGAVYGCTLKYTACHTVILDEGISAEAICETCLTRAPISVRCHTGVLAGLGASRAILTRAALALVYINVAIA